MAVDRERRTREAAPVDERRVVQLVGAHQGVGPGEGGEHAEVGGEAGGEQHGRLGVLPVGELAFELVVHRARAHDEPRRARPRAPTVDGVVRSGDDRGVVGQAEVVVRRDERHEAVGRATGRASRRGD